MNVPCPSRGLPIFLAMCALLVFASACEVHTARRQLSTRAPSVDALGEDATLKAHLRNGHVLIFDRWNIEERGGRVIGSARHYDADRNLVDEEWRTVSADTVAIFETDAVGLAGVTGFMAGVTIVSLGVTVACLSNPKACFGSCPTFYRPTGDAADPWKLVAEGFSASVAPSLEAHDVDALGRLDLRAGDKVPSDFELRVTNEAYETHMIRGADLRIVPVAASQHAGQLADDRFRIIEELLVPITATDERGSALTTLAQRDGTEWTSLADSTNLQSREDIELEFDLSEPGEYGIYIGARQSLLTTYLFYQALAYLGDSAGAWLAKLESGTLPAEHRSFDIGHRLGGIQAFVLAQDAQDHPGDNNEEWQPRGIIRETGPLAVDHDLIELGQLGAGVQRVRLRLNRGLWRIDRVALARLGAEVTPLRVSPHRVLRVDESGTHEDPQALASLLDHDARLVSFPGDEYRLLYELPPKLDSAEIFLESQGYYLEWMREEWKREENPWLAAQMFLDPGGALKRLAPDYKKLEPYMDEIFQRSRFARP